MQLRGAWTDALAEARRAGRRFEETMNPAAGLALYRQGELLRLQGDFAAAEEAYRGASRCGWEPSRGLRSCGWRRDGRTWRRRRSAGRPARSPSR